MIKVWLPRLCSSSARSSPTSRLISFSVTPPRWHPGSIPPCPGSTTMARPRRGKDDSLPGACTFCIVVTATRSRARTGSDHQAGLAQAKSEKERSGHVAPPAVMYSRASYG